MEEKLRKRKYKIFLLFLKFLPMLCALGYLLNTTLFAIFDIDAPILSNLCGLSLLPILFIYGAAEVFEFCNYHKMFIYYIGIMFLIDTFDYYIGIPLKAF